MVTEIVSTSRNQVLIEESYDFAKFLSFYLPQFHPIPENDKWHGKGFTEWTNVVAAKERFENHYQPRLPGELGFYDLRVPEVRQDQADLAKAHGVYGFVYYHYWFQGKRLLERPLNEVLDSGVPDFPFCLCWANESWSKKWGPTYGSEPKDSAIGDFLVEQTYSPDDYSSHVTSLERYFNDNRYIRVDGKPVFIIFRPSLLPNPLEATDVIREAAAKIGIGEMYLSMIQFSEKDLVDPGDWGFDSSIEFQPDRRRRKQIRLPDGSADTEYVYSYRETVDISLIQDEPTYRRHPCIMPSWDNSARRSQGATIYEGSTPQEYGRWVSGALKRYASKSSDNFIFVNSWNEWAEGSNLEPDLRYGLEYLQAHSASIIDYMCNTLLAKIRE